MLGENEDRRRAIVKEYFQRISDKVLHDHLESKGAVLIEGAKWCGKTTSAKQIAKSVIEMDRPDMTGQYQQMAKIKPLNLLEGEVVCYNMKIPNWS